VGRSPGKDLFQPLKANTLSVYNNKFSLLWSGFPLENVMVQLSDKAKSCLSRSSFTWFSIALVYWTTEVHK